MNVKDRLSIFVLYGLKSSYDYEQNISFHFAALQMWWQFSLYIPELILECSILEEKKLEFYKLIEFSLSLLH